MTARGTGLGPSITEYLTETYGGTIEVHSELGEGSTFILRLPTVSNQAVTFGRLVLCRE